MTDASLSVPAQARPTGSSRPEYTPGPWDVGYLDINSQRVVVGEHIEICTCWHHSVEAIEREMEANARLIAAAPEMLEALKRTLSWLSSYPGEAAVGPDGPWEQARAAIARATMPQEAKAADTAESEA